MANFIVITETENGLLKKASKEALTLARQLAEEKSGKVSALVVGTMGDELQADVARYGPSQIIHLDHEKSMQYSPDLWATVIAGAIKEFSGDIILTSASIRGKDLMPHISAKFEKSTAQDATKLFWEGDKLLIIRPMYAGKALASFSFTGTPQFITLRPNALPARESASNPVVVKFADGFELDAKAVLTEIIKSAGKKLDVAEAEIIVSGGRGMGGPDNWHLIEGLAEKLGAATGASRAVVDEGWRPHAEQVGQTGKTVSPQLYIAVGISGAIQHLAGMSSSKFIVAINKDPEAPIFKVADYGIVGDLFEVVPKLIDAV
jgi:electron transfer flavoprotein alpha subunit